jgi:hypothetical protein
MSKGYFTVKEKKPPEKEILQVLDSSRKNWEILNDHLGAELNLKSELKFYGVNYGWALRFIKSGKSIIALYPGKDCFTIQIILDKEQSQRAVSGNLNPAVIQKIKETEAIHEGKWIYLTIDKSTDLKDIFDLVDIRIKKDINKPKLKNIKKIS